MQCNIASINHPGVMELPSAATNEVRRNGIEIMHDHQQKQLRDIIESYRILPNKCTFSRLDEAIQQYIKTQCRNYKPVCPSGYLNHNCRFRYIDNASISKTLQPRYECKTCNRTFTLFGKSYYLGGACRKRPLAGSDDDQRCRNKIMKHKELAAAHYTASGHDEEFIIVQPQTEKTMSPRRITGFTSCSSIPNQLYASQSQWPLDVQRLPVQQHDNLWSSSSFDYPSTFFSVSNENYDQHPFQQDMKDAQANYPSISTVLAQRNYRPFESADEFGMSSLQENDVIESGDEMGIALRHLLIKQADNYNEYPSDHDDCVFPTFPSTRRNYSGISKAPSPPITHLRTEFQGQGREEEKRRGRYSIQLQCCDEIEIQPKHYSSGCQNDYPVRPDSKNNNHQNYEAACAGGGCEEMIKEYTEEAEYGLKYAKNDIAEMCVSIFDFDQTELLDEILSESMKSTYDDSCCLEELIDIDDIIIDSPVHPASTAYENRIETPNGDNSDVLKKNLNDEILILEGKGSQQMIEADENADEIIETFISSILDGNQILPGENFDSYGHESTESYQQKL